MGNFGKITKQVDWEAQKFSFHEPSSRKASTKQLVRILTEEAPKDEVTALAGTIQTNIKLDQLVDIPQAIEDLDALAKAAFARFFKTPQSTEAEVKNE